jgi:hypothetical protein
MTRGYENNDFSVINANSHLISPLSYPYNIIPVSFIRKETETTCPSGFLIEKISLARRLCLNRVVCGGEPFSIDPDALPGNN